MTNSSLYAGRTAYRPFWGGSTSSTWIRCNLNDGGVLDLLEGWSCDTGDGRGVVMAIRIILYVGDDRPLNHINNDESSVSFVIFIFISST
jgi:hypothetical protein